MDILGVRVDDVTGDEALQRCAALIEGDGPRYVVTPNPEFVVLARRDAAFRGILNGADLAIPDGGGLLLAARLFGTPLREQVRGTDLCYGLLATARTRGWRVFMLGGTPGVADGAAAAMRRRYPGLEVAGTFAGSAGPEGDVETAAAVRAAGRCDVLLVAYGARRQEEWIDRNLLRGRREGAAADRVPDVGLAIGVGGVLDFMSGRVRRAPKPVREAGLDWLFRLLIQPGRLKRQATTIPPFLALAVVEAARRRASRRRRSK